MSTGAAGASSSGKCTDGRVTAVSRLDSARFADRKPVIPVARPVPLHLTRINARVRVYFLHFNAD